MPDIRMTADEQQLVNAVLKVNMAGESQEAILKKITQAAKIVGDTYDAFGQKGATAFSGSGKEIEKYTARMMKLDDLLKQGLISQDSYGKAAEAANAKLAGSMEKAQGGLDKHIMSLGRMASGYLTVQAAIQQVTAALRDREEYENKMASQTTSVGEAQSKMLRNLAADTAEEQDRAIKDVEELAKKNTVKGGLKTAYDVYTSALTATSSNAKRSKDIADLAMQTAPDSPLEAAQTASTLGDLTKMTRTEDAKKNLGFLIGIGKLSRVKQFDDIGKNLGKAMVGTAGFGGSSKEIGAMTVAFNQAMLDETGRESGTTQIAMAEQLRDFLPEKDTYEYKDQTDVSAEDMMKGVTYTPEGRAKVVKRKGTGLKTTAERRQFIMGKGREALIDEFFSKASFEKKGIVPARQFLGLDGGVTGRLYEEAMKVIVDPEKAAPLAESQLAMWNSPYEQRVAKSTWNRENQSDFTYKTMAGREAALAKGFQAQDMDLFLQDAGVGYWNDSRWGLTASRGADVGVMGDSPQKWAEKVARRAIRTHRFVQPALAERMGVTGEAEGAAAGLELADDKSRSIANAVEQGMARAMELSKKAQDESNKIGDQQLTELRRSRELLQGQQNPTLAKPNEDK